jgi:hypothetical protein
LNLQDQQALADSQRRAAIRNALLDAAIDDYLQHPAPFAATGYGQELHDFQARLAADLRRIDGSLHNVVAVIDPEKVAEGEALGLQRMTVVRMILAAQNVREEKYAIGVANRLNASLPAKFGLAATGTEAIAFVNYRSETQEPCVIVPSSDHAMTHDIAGLNPLEERDFINRHEGWHCLDTRYHYRGLPETATELAESGDFKEIAKDPDALKAYSIRYRKEAFADLGATGDMIRAGYGPELLDHIITWRKRGAEDVMHRSIPVLEAFKAKITEMGVGNFRALSPEAARDLYYSLADTHGMSAQSLAINLRLQQAPEQRKEIVMQAIASQEGRKALAFEPYMGPINWKDDGPSTQPLTAGEKAAVEQLAKWNPSALLQQTAAGRAGKITPLTLIDAYDALQGGLRAQMKADPDNPLYPLLMTRLRETLTKDVRGLDYVAANQAFGINIVAIEPALADFRPAPATVPSSAPKPVRSSS